jgi:hypothetical protein
MLSRPPLYTNLSLHLGHSFIHRIDLLFLGDSHRLQIQTLSGLCFDLGDNGREIRNILLHLSVSPAPYPCSTLAGLMFVPLRALSAGL